MTNELRIGNYVCPMNRSWEIHMPKTLVILKVLTIGFDIETIPYNKIPAQLEKWDKYPARDIAGIPLTDEWLLKLGFKDEGTSRYPRYINKDIIVTIGAVNWWIGRKYSDDKLSLVDLKYVHQLQNLYFALTGEELQLTEPFNPPFSGEE